jgi:2-polyprenyl-3-methyl-5-hydroxy-6-metoxy-1,4-benzoquinol methylase
VLNEQEYKDKKLFDSIAINYVKKDLTPYCRVARKLRLVQSLRGIQKPIKKLLEVGCGAGFSVDYLKGKFINYTGVDYSKNLIKYAIKHNSMSGVEFECLNVNEFNSETKFDVVLMIGVLHHMPEPEKVIKSLERILTPKGIIVVNEPQAGNPIIGFLRKIRKKIDNNYSEDQVEFTRNEICSIFEKCGHEVKTYSQGILSTPLAESRLLPGFIGMPLVLIAAILDPFLEKLFSTLSLKKFTWNVIAHARKKDKN